MILKLRQSRRFMAFASAALLLVAAITPALTAQLASAAEVTGRSTTIDKAYFSATDVEYTFDFTLPTAVPIQGIVIRWCDGARQEVCAPPNNSDANAGVADQFDASAATIDSQSFSEVAAFTDGASADTGECDESTNSMYVVCLERTAPANETATAKSITLSGINHPDADGDANNFQSIYPHIYFYSDTGYTTQEHFGISAVALNDQLTVSATVAEYLAFCVGTDDAYITNNGSEVNSCQDITDTTLNLGTVTFDLICYSDEAGGNPCENSDGDKTGYALVSTNAKNGVTISYRAEQDTTGSADNHRGTLKIPGDACNVGDVSTDSCFMAAGTEGVSFANGTEHFGMTVGAIYNPAYDIANSTTRSKGTLTNNLSRDAAYDGAGNTSSGACTALDAGTDESCWAWDETGAADILATSTDVVDREMLVLNFAATASLTTPTGTYTVTSTYIATPTF